MANPEHLAIFRQGTEAWNAWRTTHRSASPDLRGANLSLANLRGIDLSATNLSRANLSGALLSRANLRDARLLEAGLSEANLSGADLRGAVLKRADLSRVNLHRADLSRADLSGANLGKADLFGTVLRRALLDEAALYETSFRDTHLEDALGLDRCHHFGPSSIDHHTLARALRLPGVFLRGCGLQAWEIAAARLYDPTLTAPQITSVVQEIERLRAQTPIQLHNLFVSYSHADVAFIDHLESRLAARHVLYWRDVHDAPAGHQKKVVTRAMRKDPTVLLVLSEHSVGRGWVEYEIHQAHTLKKALGRPVLCPVALDESWEHADWSDDVRDLLDAPSLFDYSTWRDEDASGDSFDRLLARLQLFHEIDVGEEP